MSEILFHYHRVHPATWAYLSSLLTIALFFKFSRFWSVRNLDLVLLILLAPGLLIVQYGQGLRTKDAALGSGPGMGQTAERVTGAASQLGSRAALEPGEAIDPARAASTAPPADAAKTADAPAATNDAKALRERAESIELGGYIWLFSVGGLLLTRLLFDPTMVRRPLLEPNLSMGGLTFIGCSLLVFLMANVITGTVNDDALKVARDAELPVAGPGMRWLFVLPRVTTVPLLSEGRHTPPETGEPKSEEETAKAARVIAVKTLAILGHLAIVAGMIVIGYWHFDNIKTGIGTAALYLLLPYTAQMTGYVEHVVPAAFMVWAVAFYRRPLVAGILMGMAMGMVYYPLYLLPLWLSFYWERGLFRFSSGVACVLVLLVVSLFFSSTDWGEFGSQVQQMFGLWWPRDSGLSGAWGLGWAPVYRIPVLAAFVALSAMLAIWPAQKNLGTLMSCSAAVMLGTQFWHGFGGGLFMAWYLPLALMTIFRPNLEDRVAQVVLGEGWFPKRREPVEALDQAA